MSEASPKSPLQRVIQRFELTPRNLAEMLEVSAPAARKWTKGGGMGEEKREELVAKLGFDNWGQLERFVTPHDGEVFVMRHLARDLARVWETHLAWGTSPIFETKIALSPERPLGLGFSSKANQAARRKIAAGDWTLHRVEQPRTVERLAALAVNAHYFRDRTNYKLRIVPPRKEEDLFTYPNIIRFGNKVLVMGRTHKIGAPGANNPLVMICGAAAEELGDHLETAIWSDSNACAFSMLDENERLAKCRAWAAVLDGPGGAAAFDKHYRELMSSTTAMEKIRV